MRFTSKTPAPCARKRGRQRWTVWTTWNMRTTWTRWSILAATLALAGSVDAAPLESSRALVEQLRHAGRAEATLAWTLVGPLGEPAAQRGQLALEPPSFARLDVARTGEIVTLRPDGGEWLQPQLHQMIRLSPRHAGAAMRWWRLLAGGEGARERRLGPGRYRLVVSGPTAAADSAEVMLDARGLPARLRLGEGDEAQEYRLSGWRFVKARGERDFRITAPPGIESVELP